MEVHIVGKNPNGFKLIAVLFLAASGILSAYLIYDMLMNRNIRLDFVVIAVAFLVASLTSINTYVAFMESGKKASRW